MDRLEIFTRHRSFAFLMLLECLSPTERAIFLLREVFGYDYAHIAKTVGKSIPNCRQIVRRARQHLIVRRPSCNLSLQQKEEIIQQFLNSWNQGDVYSLISLMAEDVIFWADGGGQEIAAQKPLQGCDKIARFLVAIRRSQILPKITPKIVQINDCLGILNTFEGKPQSTFSFEFSGDRIRSIFAVVNPDKLRNKSNSDLL